MNPILFSLGAFFLLGIYAITLDACLAEQVARIRCNRIFRKLGIEPIYTLEDVGGYSLDKHKKRSN